MARYANILNDDAWKVVIFTPGNEELMARMLEVLIPGKKISKLEFRPTEQHGLSVSDKISNFVYLELGRLEAKLGDENKCKSIVEQLAYSLKYMRELKECPKEFADRLFPLLFEASEFANMGIDKQIKVSEIMRTELDRIAENNYAREQGIKQGKAEENAKNLSSLKALRDLGVDIAIISQTTGLSEEEIRAL